MSKRVLVIGNSDGVGVEVCYGRGSAPSKRIRQGGAVTEKAEGIYCQSK